MNKLKLGIALCGSYCTYDKVMDAIKDLSKIYDITPIMSENSAATDTRFGKSADLKDNLKNIQEKLSSKQ